MGSTTMGSYTTASGGFSVAMGRQTKAGGECSIAMGSGTTASGLSATAIGQTIASGKDSFALGYGTTAKGDYSMAMGQFTTAEESQSLVVSGNVKAKNIHIRADARLADDIRPANATELLRIVRSLQVVEHSRSANYCTHLNLTAEDCAADRTIGFIAQQVAIAAPLAVSSGSSLRLMAPTPKGNITMAAEELVELERVDNAQSIDVHVMLSQLVGAVQAQSDENMMLVQQNEKQHEQNKKQNDQITALNEQMMALKKQNELLAEQLRALMNQTQALLAKVPF